MTELRSVGRDVAIVIGVAWVCGCKGDVEAPAGAPAKAEVVAKAVTGVEATKVAEAAKEASAAKAAVTAKAEAAKAEAKAAGVVKAAEDAAGPPWRDIEVGGEVEWVGFRGDRSLLVASSEYGAPRGLAEYDVSSGAVVARIEAGEPVGPPAAWSPATGRLAFATEEKVRIRRLGADGPDVVIAFASPSALVFSPAGDRLVVTHAEAGAAARVESFDAATGARVAREQPFGRGRLAEDSGYRLSAAFAGDRLALLLANDTPPEATLAVREAGESGKWQRYPLPSLDEDEFSAAPALGAALAASADGVSVVAGNLDARAFVLRLAEGESPRPLATGGKTVTGLAFGPDGSWFVAGGEDGPMTVLASADGARKAQLAAPERCGAFAVSPDGRRVAGGCRGKVRVWRVTW